MGVPSAAVSTAADELLCAEEDEELPCPDDADEEPLSDDDAAEEAFPDEAVDAPPCDEDAAEEAFPDEADVCEEELSFSPQPDAISAAARIIPITAYFFFIII